MLARIVLDENKGILFCIKILSSYNRHLKNLHFIPLDEMHECTCVNESGRFYMYIHVKT